VGVVIPDDLREDRLLLLREVANSMLYAACWRAAKALGYLRLITYTQDGEPGTSLRAAGWRVVAQRPARSGWHAPSRPRTNRNEWVERYLWEAVA